MRNEIEVTFDRFQVQSLIREEKLGLVYRAYDPKFNRQVAIQFLDSELATQPHIVDNFFQLARTQLRWRHPAFIRILDFGIAQGKIYTVREYIPGPSLEQALNQLRHEKAWLSLSEGVAITLEICQAIEYAHQRGVGLGQHDANNILIKPQASASLPYQPVLVNLDYGQEEPNSEGSASNSLQKDIQIIGKYLFRLITGETLLEGTPLAEISRQVKYHRPDLPHSLERILLRAINSGSGAGFASIHDLTRSLREAEKVAGRIDSLPVGFQAIRKLPVDFQDAQKIETKLVDLQEESSETGIEIPPLLSESPQILAPDEEPAKPVDEQASAEQSVADAAMVKEESPDFSGLQETALSEDTIHILLGDQSVRSVQFRGQKMTIGKDADNSIVLDAHGISRHHATIELDGEQYLVTDLDSTNGVYLENRRLQPDVPYPWMPGENLRMGEVWLRLEKAEQELSTIAIPTSQVEKEIQVKTDLTIDENLADETKRIPVEAIILDSNLSVIPGKTASTILVLTNPYARPDIFSLEILGIPAEWVPNRLQNINLPSNGQKEISLVFRPPRFHTSRAGRHSVIVRLTSQNYPTLVRDLRLALTILPFTEFSSELLTKELHTDDIGILAIRNLGNIPETFSLIWEDRLGELNFEPKRANATIPPGETVQVQYKVSPVQTRWVGSEKVYTYKTYVGSQTAQTQSQTGGLIVKSLVPTWALLTLLSLLLILFILLLVFTNNFFGSGPNSRATDQATRTLGALSIQETQFAATATFDSMLVMNQATGQAATATVIWYEADQDLDGLVNRMELQLNTRPDIPDTDEDGLTDGEEFNTYHTNPLVPDSDGDGLKDGEEILRRTDPMKKDSDGDGIEDSLDPSPLASTTPTSPATSTLTTTPSASPTASQTPTPTYPPNISDLSITLTNNSSTSIPGTNTTYTILVQNTSPVPASNVHVLDVFPSILFNPSWNCVASSGSACQAASGQGNIDLRLNLAPGGMATFTIQASINPSASGSLVNSASVSLPPDMSDPNPANNQAMDTDNLSPRVSLSISKTDNLATVEPGNALTYTIVVANQGPSAVLGLSVTDYFPDALKDISWICSASQGSSCATSSLQTSNIVTTVNLNPGGNATFTANAVVRASATGALTNTVSLVSPIDPATNNKSATDTTQVKPKADLSVSVSAPLMASVTTQITYSITITNQGPSNASGITLVDKLPDGSSFSSSDPGLPICSLLDNNLTCSLGDLAAGEQREITIVISTPLTPGIITNVVNVIADQPDPDLSNNQVIKEILIY